MNIWAVKCREKRADGNTGWHWDRYFDGEDHPATGDFHFGGPEWLRSPSSKRLIREVARGDIVLCYQKDTKAIVGITRMATGGFEGREGSGCDAFYLRRASTAFRIESPLTISELRANNCDPECFGPGTQGTVFRVSAKELACILKVMTRLRPTLKLPDWLRR